MADTLIEQSPPPEREGASKSKAWIALAISALLTVCALASVLYQAIDANRSWFAGGDIIARAKGAAVADVDQAVYLKHVEQHWSFLSTFAWWHQACVYPDLPRYWRPLTMLGFWVECHLFGAYRFDRWQAASIVFQMIFAVLLGLFAYKMTGSRFAPALTLLLFANFAPLDKTGLGLGPVIPFFDLFTTPAANVVLVNWKDQAEIWSGSLSLLALIFTLSSRWWAALVCVIVTICFKETGWLLFPMILVLLLSMGKLKAVPRSIWIASVVAAIVLLTLRALSGHDVLIGYHGGQVPHGFQIRVVLEALDGNVRLFLTSFWVVPLLGFALAWLILCVRANPIIKLLVGIGAFLAAGVVAGLMNSTDPLVGITLIMDPSGQLIRILCSLLEGLAVILAWRDPQVRKVMISLYILIVISVLPTWAVLQPNQHMLYMTNALQCTLTALVTIAACRELRRRVAPKPKRAALGKPATAA